MNAHVYRNVHITIYMWVDYNQMSYYLTRILGIKHTPLGLNAHYPIVYQ